MKKALVLILLSLLSICLYGCNNSRLEVNCKVADTDDNGNVLLDISNSAFQEIGFSYGDSLKVSFDNGLTFNDMPYYSDTYGNVNENELVAYPNTDQLYLIQKYNSFANEYDVLPYCSLTIKLNKKRQYIKTEELNNIQYTNLRENYENDAEYANFREIKIGNIKSNRLYRSSSPINNDINRANHAATLALNNHIVNIVDLIDTKEKFDIRKKIASGPMKDLYEDANVEAIGLSINYTNKDNLIKLIEALRHISSLDTPYLFHCLEGKDRTGFVCALIECLANASYDEIVDDYMETYENYCHINKEEEKEKYIFIKENNIDQMLNYICGTTNKHYFETEKLNEGAIKLLTDNGMSLEEIYCFVDKLCK